MCNILIKKKSPSRGCIFQHSIISTMHYCIIISGKYADPSCAADSRLAVISHNANNVYSTRPYTTTVC